MATTRVYAAAPRTPAAAVPALPECTAGTMALQCVGRQAEGSRQAARQRCLLREGPAPQRHERQRMHGEAAPRACCLPAHGGIVDAQDDEQHKQHHDLEARRYSGGKGVVHGRGCQAPAAAQEASGLTRMARVQLMAAQRPGAACPPCRHGARTGSSCGMAGEEGRCGRLGEGAAKPCGPLERSHRQQCGVARVNRPHQARTGSSRAV